MIANPNRELNERRESTLERAALRRIATLVSEGVQPEELFAVVAEEVACVVDAPYVAVARYEPDGTVTICGAFPPQGPLFPTGRRVPLDGVSVLGRMLEHGEPARIDDYTQLAGEIAEAARASGIRSGVGVPIVVAGRVWGSIVAWSTERLPEDFEARLSEFTELLAAAISNTGAYEALARLADEQAALRRVATLVARGAAPAEVFAAVSAEVDRLFHFDPATVDVAGVVRFEPGPELLVVGVSKSVEAVPLGSRFPPDDLFAPTHVLRTGRSARIGANDLAAVGGEVADFLLHHGYLSQVASPIVAEGRLWGAISANSRNDLPLDTEGRLERFTELVAAAIANAESLETRAQLSDEQAALRRVATLVAQDVAPAEIFSAVTKEVARAFTPAEARLVATVIRFDPGPECVLVGASRAYEREPIGSRWEPKDLYVSTQVLHTGRSARVNEVDLETEGGPDADVLYLRGFLYQVGSPVVVEGRLWGAMTLNSSQALPPDTDERLESFTELVATAIANAESRDALARLAHEQAALRRVATLVARGAPPGEVFDAVAMEVGTLLDTDITVVGRYDGDGAATAIGSWSASPGGVPVGTRSVVGGRNVLTLVAETAKPARVDGYDDASGDAAEIARSHGWRSSIAAPIIVEDRLWGVMLVATQGPERFPAGAEKRLAAFTDLVATALANAQAHDAVRRFGEEHAALGRVATLVATGAAPEHVFTAVVDEASTLLGLERIEFVRYGDDNMGTVIAASGEHPFPPGSTWSLEHPSVMATVARTGRAARIDDYGALKGDIARVARSGGFQSAIGAPLTVEGRLWGVIIAISTEPELIPERSEARLGQFTELVATAVANAEARQALERVAAGQAALRRVATLVAHDVPPAEVFDAVAMEVCKLLDTDLAAIGRYDGDGTATTVGSWSPSLGAHVLPVGTRSAIGGRNALTLVAETGRPARIDSYDDASGEAAEIARRHGHRATIAAPIMVEGRPWGVMLVVKQRPEPFSAGAEERLSAFTDLVATAIANAESKSELAASRRRIVAAADEARRRIERDLHDGIQQRLIALTFRARAMTRKPPDELPGIAAELSEGLKDASDELREVSRGIHPTILTEAGLAPALRALARRSNVPIDVDVSLDQRLPEPVEAAAYYIASEALTNVEKHARANVVRLTAAHDIGILTIEVRDDGIGGVDAGRGSGILGLTDRVDALGGTIAVSSPPRSGTTLTVRLPTTTT